MPSEFLKYRTISKAISHAVSNLDAVQILRLFRR